MITGQKLLDAFAGCPPGYCIGEMQQVYMGEFLPETGRIREKLPAQHSGAAAFPLVKSAKKIAAREQQKYKMLKIQRKMRKKVFFFRLCQ